MAAAVPPANVFALHPAELDGANFINYATTEGRKMYERAIEPLAIKYDGEQKGLKIFLHDVACKASTCGWTQRILTIPVPDDGGVDVGRSLLIQYGMITVDHIRAHAATYFVAPPQGSRAMQDASNLKQFLDQSLAPDLMMRVLGQKDQYTFNGGENGPAMLRVVLSLVGINTRATVSVIRASLRNLPSKMTEVNSNITKFNEFVKSQVSELTARGETTDDLMSSLFDAYRTADDDDFVNYMQMKENDYEDDGAAAVTTPEEIMNVAEAKYKIMIVKRTWKATASKPKAGAGKDDDFIALKATMKTVLKTLAKKNGKGAHNAQFEGKWAWKLIAPKGSEPHTREFEGKKYVVCANHPPTHWVLAEGHRDGCRLDQKPGATNSTGNNDKKATQADKQTLQYVKALMHVMQDDDEDGPNANDSEEPDEENV